MKIVGVCFECLGLPGDPLTQPGGPSAALFEVAYYEDRLATIECARGHKSAMLLQSQKFEILMESGANALNADFTMEAVASFSAALERFYEFGLKVLAFHQKMQPDIYERMFKVMARQSERQLGAFTATYAAQFGEDHVPDPAIVKFRNDVIHKGTIPIPSKAAQFCEMVYAEILRLSGLLEAGCSDAIQAVIVADLIQRQQKIPKGMQISTSSGAQFFCLANQVKAATFAEALLSYTDSQKRLQSLPSIGSTAGK